MQVRRTKEVSEEMKKEEAITRAVIVMDYKHEAEPYSIEREHVNVFRA